MTTQLTAINWAKVITIGVICLLILLFGIKPSLSSEDFVEIKILDSPGL